MSLFGKACLKLMLATFLTVYMGTCLTCCPSISAVLQSQLSVPLAVAASSHVHGCSGVSVVMGEMVLGRGVGPGYSLVPVRLPAGRTPAIPAAAKPSP
jgi:hypothetical protein